MTDDDRFADDELLSAYLDGELADPEAEQLRERLDREPELAARLEALRESDAKLRRGYASIVDAPLPQSVVDLLHGGSETDTVAGARDERASDGSRNVTELRPRSGTRPVRAWVPAAAAAAVALVVGGLAGHLIGRGGDTSSRPPALAAGLVEPGTPMHEILERLPSSETRTLGADLSATPVLTFRTESGDFCRELRIAGADGTTAALACRRAGRWQFEVASFAPQSTARDGVYRPATGGATAVSAAIEDMIAGERLGPEAERTLIANDWSSQR